MKHKIFASAVAVLALTGAANAATVFEEDFSGDAAGGSVLNFDSFAQFSVDDGTVDIIRSPDYSITCATGGGCVDLDGSSRDSGVLSSISLTFLAGVDYTLSASLSGNQRVGGTDTGTYGVTGIFSASFAVTGNAFSTFSETFSVGSDTSGSVFFENDGGDNFGAVLDQVSVTSADMAPIPLPASALLMLGALGGLAGLRRRKG